MPAIAQAAVTSTAPIPLVTRGSETKSATINWIWPGRIARAKLTLFAGEPGSGKSALAASITATVTTGGAYPCREGRAQQGAVLLVCPDADPDVLIPRLKAAGADLGRVQLMRHVEGAKGPRRFDLATDLPVLAQAARSIKDLSLIVIDGLYVPAGRSATRAMQALLDPLAAFAESHRVGVAAILGLGFNEGSRRIAAFEAQALGAVCAAFALELDPAEARRRVLVQVKNDLAPDRGLIAFRIASRQLDRGQSAARVEFEPQHHPLSPREFAARQSRSLNSATTDAMEFLSALFGSARQLKVAQIEHEARAAGLLRANQQLTQSRPLRDARMAMGLGIIREGADSGAWVWAKAGTVESTLQDKPEVQPNPPTQSEGQSPLLSKAAAHPVTQPGQMQQVA
ncbi:MAG: AAA family ATPase [Xanthobacteraceae bacterium]|nr:AAA family ATPase [Xanthobacteraceae bacterium]